MGEKTINALMNTDGGYLYLGIDDQWRIKGISTSEVDLNGLKRAVTESLSEFEPFVPQLANAVDYQCFAVITKKGELVPDKVVVRMDVQGPIDALWRSL